MLRTVALHHSPSNLLFLKEPAHTVIYTLSLHDALPIWSEPEWPEVPARRTAYAATCASCGCIVPDARCMGIRRRVAREVPALNPARELDAPTLSPELGQYCTLVYTLGPSQHHGRAVTIPCDRS